MLNIVNQSTLVFSDLRSHQALKGFKKILKIPNSPLRTNCKVLHIQILSTLGIIRTKFNNKKNVVLIYIKDSIINK